MTDPAADAARVAAAVLAPGLDPNLPTEVEAALAARDPQLHPERYVAPVSLASLIVAIATLAWTIYNDQRTRTANPTPASIARQVRIALRDRDDFLPDGIESITEVITTEITRFGASQGEELTPDVTEGLLTGNAEVVAALARRGEGQRVELKRELPQDVEVARELAGFANSGGGVLIVGVADDGEVAGWRPADADVAVRRMRRTANSVLPNLVHVRRGQVESGWLAWAMVEESEDEPVVTADGAYWQRVSNQVRRGELPLQGLIDSDPRGSKPLPASGPVRAFVAMSFREEEEPALVDYFQAMQRAAQRARRDFSLRRVDQVEGDYEIVDLIYKEIDAAQLVIADLTLSPPNVYLELGYARGCRKHVIQTCRSDTKLEFDVRGRRTLIYRNATMLEHMLLRELDAL